LTAEVREGETMSTKTDEIRDALSAYYQTRRSSGQPVEITDVAPLEGGRQHEMYTFNLIEGKGVKTHIQTSVLRLYDGATAGENAEYEYRIMEKLGPSDVPVPEVFVLERDAKYLGRPFIVMEKVKGEDFDSFAGRKLAADPSGFISKEAPIWISRLGALLASVHKVDRQALGLDFLEFPRWSVESITEILDLPEIQYMAGRNEKLGELLDWLRVRIQEAVNPEVVMLHFDFHTQNVMVSEGKIVALLDWCEACPGDAALDVGWSNLLFHMRDAGEVIDAFVTEYKRHSGRELNNLTFYEVVAGCRQLFDLLAVREGRSLELDKRPDAADLVDVNTELAKTVNFIYQRTGIDISSA